MTNPPNARPSSLSAWLDYLITLHPKNIELGLERVNQVFQRMAVDFGNTKVVTVAGTNGKGTTCALVEQACISSGLRCAVYSSPHLLDYRERVRVNQQLLDEQAHLQAFHHIESLRQDTALTFFEFTTLAALHLLAQQSLDVIILEVGLGGRLDAVNVVEPDISVITTIAIDHQDWLGDTREKIGIEKAGILRTGKDAVIGEPDLPDLVAQHIAAMNAKARYVGRDFRLLKQSGGYTWQGQYEADHLNEPGIVPMNAATALAVIECLGLTISSQSVNQWFDAVSLPGRVQKLSDKPLVIADVAHNPQACEYLQGYIQKQDYQQLHLVVGMLNDKDSKGCLASFERFSPHWYLGSLTGPRAASAEQLAVNLPENTNTQLYDCVTAAYCAAMERAQQNDLILVFGSFHTVADVLQYRLNERGES